MIELEKTGPEGKNIGVKGVGDLDSGTFDSVLPTVENCFRCGGSRERSCDLSAETKSELKPQS